MRTRCLIVLAFAGLAAAQNPTVTGVSNAVSFAPALCPGVLSAVFGTNFGTDRTVLTASVGGKAAPVLNATPSQLLVQIPVDAAVGATSITITKTGSPPTAPFNITLGAYAPAVFAIGTDAQITGSSGNPNQIKRGDVISILAVGLGATNPPAVTGAQPTPGTLANCVTKPEVRVAGVAVVPDFCGLAPGTVGVYQVNFKIPDGVASGKQSLLLTIGGISSPAVNITLAGAPTITSVVNGASLDKSAPIAPGSIVTVLCSVLNAKDQVTGFPNTTLQSVSVAMNGFAAPLVSVQATGAAAQIQVIAPIELPEQGAAQVVVTTADGSSSAFSVTMAAASPGIFRTGYKNYGAVTLSGPSYCAAPGALAAANCGRPFKPGDTIQIFATGLGKATPSGDPNGAPLGTGQLAPADPSVVYSPVIQPAVTVGGIAATVASAVLVPGLAGEYQISVVIPDGTPFGDDVPLKLTSGAFSDSVSIAVVAP